MKKEIAMLNRRNLFKIGLAASAMPIMPNIAFAQVNAPEKWDESYDVVIVGAGSAGLAAACEAIDKKLSFCILEKEPVMGGSSALNGGNVTVAGTKAQKELGIEDSAELFVKDMRNVGKGVNNEAVVRAFVDAIYEHYVWLTDVRGLKTDKVVQQGGQSVPRSHHIGSAAILKTMRDYVEDHGFKVELRTPVRQLVWSADHSRIGGVLAERRGKKVFIEAKKGVLLAAGGFARNAEMVSKYNPPLIHAQPISGLGCVGDGVKMAQSVGADMLDVAYISATYGFKVNPSTIKDLSTIYWSGAIVVNKDAKRFTDESQSYKTISSVALMQPEAKSYIVFNQKILEKDYPKNPLGKELWDPIFKENKLPDYVYRADTLADVAKQAGLDPAELEATVKTYNEEAKNGEAAFGRKHLIFSGTEPIFPIDEGPYYIFPATAALTTTYCGVKITPKGRVVDVFGEEIPGLYAAGEMTGGIHGAGYLSGSAFAKAQAFGRICVRDMSEL